MNISENEIKRICSPVIYKRGIEYYKDGRVHIKSREENSISAVVDGESIYNIRIDFDNDTISRCYCTCPYYQTMGTNCKHIVAALKKRQTELLEGESVKDENDKIAQSLLEEFAGSCFEKPRMRIKFILNITGTDERRLKYSIELLCGFEELKSISGVDKFIECYINKTDFKLSKHKSVNLAKYSFGENEQRIIEILSEAYQNKISGGVYINRVSNTFIAPTTAKRIFPLLQLCDCELYYNSIPINDYKVVEDNPDIVIDVSATDTEISLNIFESGTALFGDGSWFIYENCLYHTDSEWRSWFMPIYNSLKTESRTQIDFSGETRVDFATYVYPKIRNKRGVATTGLDAIVINEKPVFNIYLDADKRSISASINVNYGNIRIPLPSNIKPTDKIVIRDTQKEARVLSYFSDFEVRENMLSLSDDERTFKFIREDLSELAEFCNVHTSKRFDSVIKSEDFIIKTNAAYSHSIDLLEVGFETELSPEEIYAILNAVSTKKEFYRLSDGSIISLSDDNIKEFRLLKNLDFTLNDINKGKKAVSKYHLLYLEALKEQGELDTDSGFDRLIEEIHSIKAEIPEYLDNVLRNYQKVGVCWMKQLSELGFGGVLADDMGLGKTLEVIAFVMSEKAIKPVLVVAPSALTYNWVNEITKFAPSAKYILIDGTKEERELLTNNVSGVDFVITSYALLRRDMDLYEKLEFSYMFIDESQNIKNPSTLNAKSVKHIRAERKFALSGTPVENNLMELWSVFDFALKGYLDTKKEFSNIYSNININEDETLLEELKNKVKPFILRRMKTDVLSELPDKIEHTVYSELIPEQKKMYEAFRMAAKKEVTDIINTGGSKIQILTLLLRLRQICCHPSLFDTNYKKDSGKLMLLEEIVSSAISQGHRILIFSQFTSMLTIIRKRLEENGIESYFIDGKTPSSMRTVLCDNFNAGEKEVFLISLKAGGTGLNLTGADMVIHFDPWWNPAVTDQASDRAYRIGQTKAVEVIKLAARGTIEEQILKLQEAKKELAQSVITQNAKTISKLTREEILSLFE